MNTSYLLMAAITVALVCPVEHVPENWALV
jgi:hypothetical protein